MVREVGIAAHDGGEGRTRGIFRSYSVFLSPTGRSGAPAGEVLGARGLRERPTGLDNQIGKSPKGENSQYRRYRRKKYRGENVVRRE